MILIVDFNMPEIAWENYSAMDDVLSEKYKLFQQFCFDLGFTEIVDFPTRGKNLLDLVLTNDPLLLSNVSGAPLLASSDHDSIHLAMLIPTQSFSLSNVIISETYITH